MLISLLISLLVSNAVTLRRDKSILFYRVVITGLFFTSFLALNSLFIKAFEKCIAHFLLVLILGFSFKCNNTKKNFFFI